MRFLLLLVLCSFTNLLSAGWNNMNTGINDHLTGVIFWGNNGLVSGHKGLYYTTTGGSGAASWSRFNITTNASDSALYNRTVFSHAMSETGMNGNGLAFVCGRDTVNNKAVIMKVNLPAMSYSIIYTGATGTSLNRMCSYPYTVDSYYAVGDNGLIISFSSTTATVVTTGFNHNLTSINFGSSTMFAIGANGVQITGTRSSATVLTFSFIYTAAYNYVGIAPISPNSGVGVGNGLYKWTLPGQTPYALPNYDFGNLNARSIMGYNSAFYVGTDHGIFKSSNTYSFLEWQPSSLSYEINSFWNAYNSSTFYACGDNGTLLSTTDFGGLPKPYAGLDSFGGCKGASTPVTGETGSSNSCQWYINNVLFNSACYNVTHTFPASGQYTVQLNISNGPGSYDTAIAVINIVDTPKINKPYILSKTIICRQEPITISIDSSQLNVFYNLKKYGTVSNFGSSGPGNNSTISYSSAPLSIAGNYYIQAQSTMALCTRKFKDTIKIGVEHTKAKFHLATLNATQGESVSCFQQCIDAQNYLWTFTPGGNPYNSSSANPYASFSTLGPTQIKLVCWSNNGCYDSTLTNGPAVYQEPATPDSCWTMVNNGVDPYWSGFYPPDISKLSPSKTGFYTCGHFNIESFASRYGDSVVPPYGAGIYVQKTNRNGVAKWIAYSRQTASGAYREQVNTVAEDPFGNVYIGGRLSGPFYDNRGDSTLLASPNMDNYLLKLDSLGKLIWVMKGILPNTISFDKSNNLVVTTNSLNYQVYLNGTLTFTSIPTSPACNFALMKISQAGAVLWNAPMYIYYTNGGGITNAQVDRNNNIYLAGTVEHYVNIYSAGSSTYTTVSGVPGNYGGKLFVARYDSTGVLQWTIRSILQGIPSNDDTHPFSMIADEDGNSYITGRNNYLSSGNIQIFENTDGSITSLAAGGYYVAKVNNAGICKWIQGSKYAYIGWGSEINKLGNEISVVGQISNNAATIQTSNFTSANNDSITISISRADYFIAVYDTLGNLQRITKNGNNPNLVDTYSFSGMFRENDGSYFISRNFRFYNGAANFDNFGTNVIGTNGVDGSITKYSGSCGITYYPTGMATLLIKTDASDQLIVYPNPNNGIFTIESDAISTYVIYDLLGKTVNEGTLRRGKNHIILQNNESGIYVLKTQNTSFKLIKY